MPYEMYRMEGLEGRVAKLEKDVIHGNGLPGLTTRMAIQEGDMEDVKERMATLKRETKESLESINGKFWALISLVLATLVGVIVNIVVKAK